MKLSFTSMAGLLFAALSSNAQADPLTVYAPDYFASEWGPGPAIKAAFEAKCDCDLNFVTGDVLPRLLLEGKRTKADVVIGLNTDVTHRARETGIFANHGLNTDNLTMPIEWNDPDFIPFNWSYFAFIYDNQKIKNVPQNFEDLIAMDDIKIVIQDPRSSVTGLGLLLWIKSIYGDGAEQVWQRLSPKILTVTQGWTESYGMFTDGEADMVLSFTTSPAYHLIAEDDDTKSAAIFDEGHYFMAELAGKVASTDQPELASAFMEFVLSEEFQSLIPEGNWSYPAKLEAQKLPEKFNLLGTPQKTLLYSPEEVQQIRKEAVSEWLSALSQ